MNTQIARRAAACLLLVAGSWSACSSHDPSPKAQAQTKTDPSVSSAAPASKEATQLTRYARLLAGVDDPAASPDDRLRNSEAFRAHSRHMAELWAAYESNEATKIRPWADTELVPTRQGQTLFYPFAGADFLFANAFFPNARTMVLVGLERVGDLADLGAIPAKSVEQEYGRLAKAVAPVVRASFFNTLEMQTDTLQDGVLTVFVTLMAGTHHRILAVDHVSLWEDGRVTVRAKTDPPSTPAGVRIQFAAEGEAEPRTLYYFRTDLSDKGLAKQGGLLAFADTLPAKVGFAKAAAYCMHSPEFSMIRNYMLSQTQAVLQDDTGVPLKYFDRKKWDVHLFGHYTSPIQMFTNYRQRDLAAAYADTEHVTPLEFHIGYGSNLPSNLLLAVRRDAPGTTK